MTATASSAKPPSKQFLVAVIGATEGECEILERIFGVTRYRPRSYQLVAINDLNSKSEWAKARAANIFIVNVNNAKAVVCWHKFTTAVYAEKRKPALQLGRKSVPGEAAAEFSIPSPINPTRLLQTLDNYTIHHLGYYPEFQIGSDLDPCSATVRNINAIANSAKATSIGVKTQPETTPRQALRVLVADDSLAVRRQLKIEFDSMDAQLDSVADGEAAVKAAERVQYDVIFLDVVMPGMDGYSVCKNIRRSNLNKSTPVVMLTSRSSKFDKLKGILAGCDTYLTKPVNHNEFKAITQKHLNKSMEKTA